MTLHPFEHEQRIEFHSSSHTYQFETVSRVWEQVPLSVTTLVRDSFHIFDVDKVVDRYFDGWHKNPNSKYYSVITECLGAGKDIEDAKKKIKMSWIENGNRAAQKGNRVHAAFEACMLNPEEYPCARLTDWIQKMKLQQGVQLTPISAELKVFLEKPDGHCAVAGCIDALFVDQNNDHWLVDWKTSKGILQESSETVYKFGTGACKSIPDTKFYRYSLQLALYTSLLKSCANIEIDTRRLIVVATDEMPLYEVIPDTLKVDLIAKNLINSLL